MATIIPLILKAVPWQGIFAVILKLVFSIWDKNDKYKESKKLMLKLINEVDRQTPIKVRVKYNRDIEELKKEIRQQEIFFKKIVDERNNYKNIYEKTVGAKND